MELFRSNLLNDRQQLGIPLVNSIFVFILLKDHVFDNHDFFVVFLINPLTFFTIMKCFLLRKDFSFVFLFKCSWVLTVGHLNLKFWCRFLLRLFNLIFISVYFIYFLKCYCTVSLFLKFLYIIFTGHLLLNLLDYPPSTKLLT